VDGPFGAPAVAYSRFPVVAPVCKPSPVIKFTHHLALKVLKHT
jgi:hypothetical protein